MGCRTSLLYFLSSIIIAVTAIIALRQLKITKKEIVVNSKRDTLRITAKQCENYLKNIVPLHLELDNQIEKNNIKFFEDWKVEIKNDHLEVIHNSPIINDIQPVVDIIISTLDAMESFANYFIFKLADQEQAYSTVGSSYIAIIEKLMPLVFHFIKMGHYRNTVQLFIWWKTKNTKDRLLYDKEIIDEEINQMSNYSIIPIGT